MVPRVLPEIRADGDLPAHFRRRHILLDSQLQRRGQLRWISRQQMGATTVIRAGRIATGQGAISYRLRSLETSDVSLADSYQRLLETSAQEGTVGYQAAPLPGYPWVCPGPTP